MSTKYSYQLPCPGKSRQPALTAVDLDVLQTKIGKLPQDYLEFLQRWNELLLAESMWFPLADAQDDDDVGCVGIFYGVGGGNSASDLYFGNAAYNFSNRVPEHYHAIGRDMGWDFVCMKLDKPTFGSIHYWRPGEGWPEEEEVASTDYLRPIADSFWGFWQLLKHEDDMNFSV